MADHSRQTPNAPDDDGSDVTANLLEGKGSGRDAATGGRPGYRDPNRPGASWAEADAGDPESQVEATATRD